MRFFVLAALTAALIAAACGSDGSSTTAPSFAPTPVPDAAGDGILRLPQGDLTEDELRNIERVYISTFYSEVICGDYLGHSDEEVLQARIRDYEAQDPTTLVRPLAEVSEADLLLAGVIRREECEELSP